MCSQAGFLIHLCGGDCILSAIRIQVNLHSRQYSRAKTTPTLYLNKMILFIIKPLGC